VVEEVVVVGVVAVMTTNKQLNTCSDAACATDSLRAFNNRYCAPVYTAIRRARRHTTLLERSFIVSPNNIVFVSQHLSSVIIIHFGNLFSLSSFWF